MAKFLTGFFVGAVGMAFLLAQSALIEEQEKEMAADRDAADAVSRAKTPQQ